MNLGDKKPEKRPIYIYYIIVAVVILLLNFFVLHSFAVTYVRLSPEILLFPGFQAFFISIFSHILLDIYGCICYNSHSGGAYYAFKENKNQYRTYLSCDC